VQRESRPHVAPCTLQRGRTVRLHAPAGRPEAITARAVLLGLAGALQVAVVQVSTKVRPTVVIPPWVSAPYLSWYAILPGAIFWLFLVAALNTLVRRRRPGAALRPAELAVIFGMTTVAAGIAAQDAVMQLVPLYLFPFRATQADSMVPFRRHIPAWIVPQESEIVEPYYRGSGSFWTVEPLLAWMVPLATWMVYLVALGGTMWAWNVILRRRWMDHDRLAFPNVQLPLEICRAGGLGGALSGRLFWGGVVAAAAVESLAQVHQMVPTVPYMPVIADLSPLLEALPSPWNALSPMMPMLTPLHLGVAFFIPLDILFSSGFFYLLRKGLEVYGRARGWRDLGWDAAGFPYARSQAAGAWAVLFILLIWAERRHLRRVLAAALARTAPTLDDAEEPGSYRWAGRILIAGTLFLIAFSVAGGMSLRVALLFYAFFWMLNVTMTRVYAQVGPPTLELYFLDPQKTLTTLFGTRFLSPGGATHLSLMYWLNRTSSGQPMAHQLAAFYVGRQVRAAPRVLGRWVFVAFVVGALACLLAVLHYAYRVGEDQWVEGGWRERGAVGAVARINDWVGAPRGPDWKEIGFMFLGGGTTAALARVSMIVAGFPLHPIGFALAMCYGVEYTWPSFLVMWAFKGALLRYGGLRQFQGFRSLFLGLILGGLITPVFWGLAAWLFRWYL
jgi:hypothetical protein